MSKMRGVCPRNVRRECYLPQLWVVPRGTDARRVYTPSSGRYLFDGGPGQAEDIPEVDCAVTPGLRYISPGLETRMIPWFLRCKIISPDDHVIVQLGDVWCQCGEYSQEEIINERD